VCRRPTINGGTEEVEGNDTGPLSLTGLGVHLVRVWKIPGDFDTVEEETPRLEEYDPDAKGSVSGTHIARFLPRRGLVALIRCCWLVRSACISGKSNYVVLYPLSLPGYTLDRSRWGGDGTPGRGD
jgi:hypothetical protein